MNIHTVLEPVQAQRNLVQLIRLMSFPLLGHGHVAFSDALVEVKQSRAFVGWALHMTEATRSPIHAEALRWVQ